MFVKKESEEQAFWMETEYEESFRLRQKHTWQEESIGLSAERFLVGQRIQSYLHLIFVERGATSTLTVSGILAFS